MDVKQHTGREGLDSDIMQHLPELRTRCTLKEWALFVLQKFSLQEAQELILPGITNIPSIVGCYQVQQVADEVMSCAWQQHSKATQKTFVVNHDQSRSAPTCIRSAAIEVGTLKFICKE